MKLKRYSIAILAAGAVIAGAVTPQIPQADRNMPGRIFLERADSLVVTQSEPDVQVLVGNVQFRHGGMLMYCDSARFYTSPTLPADSMEAYGNIRMEQGDTLFLYGDVMEYSGTQELTTIWGNGAADVRLINRDVTLTAPVLYYSLGMELGYYDSGGTLTDPQNRLTSIEGEYAPPTREANFYDNVRLTGRTNAGDTVRVYTDTLFYNVETHIAELPSRARITGKDGDILTTDGIFDTEANTAVLLKRSTVHTRQGNTLTGDSLIYDRTRGIGEAFGAMVLTDSVMQMVLEGDYGYYNELTDSAYCTGRARAMDCSQPDTLYLHGEAIRTWVTADSVRLTVANPGVRFYRRDMQGVCDSMTFVQQDSVLYMDVEPIVWSDARQIFGDRISVWLNDSTVEKAIVSGNAFMAEQIEGEYFDQMSGKEMIACFTDGDLRQLDVNGSVQAIMFPEENDSTYNKMASVESSFLQAFFQGRELERAKLWDQTSGVVTPLYLTKRSQLYLPKFKWLEALRPKDPEDIFQRGSE